MVQWLHWPRRSPFRSSAFDFRKSIRFSVLSGSEIRKSAEVQVWNSRIYGHDMKPVPNGLLDMRMVMTPSGLQCSSAPHWNVRLCCFRYMYFDWGIVIVSCYIGKCLCSIVQVVAIYFPVSNFRDSLANEKRMLYAAPAMVHFLHVLVILVTWSWRFQFLMSAFSTICWTCWSVSARYCHEDAYIMGVLDSALILVCLHFPRAVVGFFLQRKTAESFWRRWEIPELMHYRKVLPWKKWGTNAN